MVVSGLEGVATVVVARVGGKARVVEEVKEGAGVQVARVRVGLVGVGLVRVGLEGGQGALF